MMKKIVSVILALMMVLGIVSASAETVKHERVYVVADANGQISTLIDSVRLENGDALPEIADRTTLTGIENVGGHETFVLSGEDLTWQANGRSIRYQGQGSKAPAVTPAVTCLLDGEVISAAELVNATGHLDMTVTCTQEETVPCLVLSVIPVPAGVTGLTLENAILLDEGIASLIVGFTVQGMDASLPLPVSFTVSCDVDHADFSWMMTVASSEPLRLAAERLSGGIDLAGAEGLLADGISVLTALSQGDEMPPLEGDMAEAAQALDELLKGTVSVADGADQVREGIVSLQAGVGELQDGLGTLTDNNEQLNAGAEGIVQAIMTTANGQLAAAGLDAYGITLQPLTRDNYSGVIDGVTAAIGAAAQDAEATARAQVSAAVEAQDETIRAAVTEAVREKVLAAVLGAAGVQMDAQQYAAAVQAGLIPEVQAAQLTAAVQAQMDSDEIQAQLTLAVAQQKAALVEENMASEAVQARIAAARDQASAATEELNGLKAQLDAVCVFAAGLKSYTDGVSQIEGVIGTMKSGIDTLADGSAALSEGASELSDRLHAGIQSLAGKYLPYLRDSAADIVRIYEDTVQSLRAPGGYDLTGEGIREDTIYIIRTTLDR